MHNTHILNSIDIPIWVFDVDRSRIAWANNRALGFWNSPSLEELCARDLSDDMSDTVRLSLQQYLQDCTNSDATFYEQWTLYPLGTPTTYQLALRKHILEDGRHALLVHALKETLNTHADSLHSMQALKHTSAMITVFSENLDLIYANPAARETMGKRTFSLNEYLVEEADLDDIMGTCQYSGSCCAEVLVNTAHGQYWHSLNIEICPDPETAEQTYVISATDVTEKRKIQQQTKHQAYSDPLTGLANRFALTENIERLIAAGDTYSFALLFLDLNRLKLVNDTLGHRIGDFLLCETAKFLQTVSCNENFVARLSGDEFVLILENASRAEINKCLQAILKLAHLPMKIEGFSVRVSPSIGVSMYPRDGQSYNTLMRNADIALYTAKSGSDGYRLYDSVMGQEIKNRLALEADMAEAIQANQFELYYQPKVQTSDLEIIEMEALIRWHHPVRGMVSPLDFIPVAEESGMILEIGEWVINQALTDQLAWQALGYQISVAVNVSPKQFTAPDFLDRLRASLTRSNYQPQMLNLEVTESSLIGDEGLVQNILNQLSGDGIKISIDDFGTGYSNLANLHKYPIHCLKIDRAFLNDNNDKALLTTILEMGKAMNLTVVAEGVETEQQIQWLRDRQCDQLQGYYFSKPIPYSELINYLATYHQLPQLADLAA